MVVLALAAIQGALAQFQPPSTVIGSISDAAGPVAENVKVEAYIGDVQCGLGGKTYFAGEGAARVTVYVVDVVSDSQTAGCGAPGKDVRIKIGDRFVTKAVKWEAGLVRLDVTFGNATPVPIPTSTPAPTNTPGPTVTNAPNATSAPVQTIPPGSPGAGSPVPTSPRGGITSATPGQQAAASSGDDGAPVWVFVVLILSIIGAAGGAIGYLMARGRRSAGPEDDYSEPME
jgi:hypothetical protein